MKALFVAVQDPITRRWSPVGRLSLANGMYEFAYTKGVKEISGFSSFDRMGDLSRKYYSKDLFPIFNNRILPKSRPEHQEYLGWLGLTEDSHNALLELQRTAGSRATDNIELIPYPEPNSAGEFEIYFFARGLSHMPESAQKMASALKVGDPLYLMKDVQNSIDETALLMRTREPISAIGYVPKYYSHDLCEILRLSGPKSADVTVERVNFPAPLQYRVLCKVIAKWPTNFVPCNLAAFAEYVEQKKEDLVEHL